VLDLADAHLRALDHLRRGGASDVLNVGTGVGSSVQEVIAATAAIAGRDVPTIVAPRRAGDPPAIWADSARAERVLGWKAQRALPAIIESALRWHTQGPDAGTQSADPGSGQ
jgi:UDP-glucose 4-epimerase